MDRKVKKSDNEGRLAAESERRLTTINDGSLKAETYGGVAAVGLICAMAAVVSGDCF